MPHSSLNVLIFDLQLTISATINQWIYSGRLSGLAVKTKYIATVDFQRNFAVDLLDAGMGRLIPIPSSSGRDVVLDVLAAFP